MIGSAFINSTGFQLEFFQKFPGWSTLGPPPEVIFEDRVSKPYISVFRIVQSICDQFRSISTLSVQFQSLLEYKCWGKIRKKNQKVHFWVKKDFLNCRMEFKICDVMYLGTICTDKKIHTEMSTDSTDMSKNSFLH